MQTNPTKIFRSTSRCRYAKEHWSCNFFSWDSTHQGHIFNFSWTSIGIRWTSQQFIHMKFSENCYEIKGRKKTSFSRFVQKYWDGLSHSSVTLTAATIERFLAPQFTPNQTQTNLIWKSVLLYTKTPLCINPFVPVFKPKWKNWFGGYLLVVGIFSLLIILPPLLWCLLSQIILLRPQMKNRRLFQKTLWCASVPRSYIHAHIHFFYMIRTKWTFAAAHALFSLQKIDKRQPQNWWWRRDKTLNLWQKVFLTFAISEANWIE